MPNPPFTRLSDDLIEELVARLSNSFEPGDSCLVVYDLIHINHPDLQVHEIFKVVDDNGQPDEEEIQWFDILYAVEYNHSRFFAFESIVCEEFGSYRLRTDSKADFETHARDVLRALRLLSSSDQLRAYWPDDIVKDNLEAIVRAAHEYELHH